MKKINCWTLLGEQWQSNEWMNPESTSANPIYEHISWTQHVADDRTDGPLNLIHRQSRVAETNQESWDGKGDLKKGQMGIIVRLMMFCGMWSLWERS